MTETSLACGPNTDPVRVLKTTSGGNGVTPTSNPLGKGGTSTSPDGNGSTDESSGSGTSGSTNGSSRSLPSSGNPMTNEAKDGSSTSSKSGGGGLSEGAKIGIGVAVAGIVIGALLLAGFIYWYRNRNRPTPQDDVATQVGSSAWFGSVADGRTQNWVQMNNSPHHPPMR